MDAREKSIQMDELRRTGASFLDMPQGERKRSMRLENEQQLQKLTLKFIHQYRRSGGANACSDVHSKCNPTHDFPLQRSLTNMSHRPGLTTPACLNLPLNYFS
jgi:hypothetical protein